MVLKEILCGFTVAVFISVFVPQVFWVTLFIGAGGGQGLAFLAVLENAAVAPIVAFFTFIGSMGNVPLAAMLWSKGNSVGGEKAFLDAERVDATVIWIPGKYYGWRSALYKSALASIVMFGVGGSLYYALDLFGGYVAR